MYADLAQRLPSNTRRWQSDEFLAELADWVGAEVGHVRSLESAKLRVWAGVWRADTASGVHYAKQNCQLQSFEATVVPVLAELSPHRVVPVTATDPDRGLLLTPDQGPVFADTVGEDLDAWGAVVAASARLQREVAPAVDRLSGAGMATLAPADAEAYVERRVEELASLPSGHPMALASDRAAALQALRPTIAEWVDQVASLDLPVTLNHSDLHGHNVFKVGEDLRFFDFADSMLTEPLGALLIPLNVLSGGARRGPRRRAAVARRRPGAGGVERPRSAAGPARRPAVRPPALEAGAGRELGTMLHVDDRRRAGRVGRVGAWVAGDPAPAPAARGGVRWGGSDLNRRPSDYESLALTN